MDRNDSERNESLPYTVRLEMFEGPLDLLLHLIKKNQISITDIPIALITEQYLEYLKLIKVLNLDVAGEYLLMASTLLHIKSKTLLPTSSEEEEEEGEDPRAELARRLLEYQKYKEAGIELERRPLLDRDVFIRSVALETEEPEQEENLNVNLFELLEAFRKVLERAKPEIFHEVMLEQITVEVSQRVPKSKDKRKRKQPRSARTAVLAIRAVRVKLQAPNRAGTKLADVEVNVVLVREIEPPEGEEAIEWLLLTSLPIGTMEDVHRIIQYYCCRWNIEIYYRILKSGCKVEESQLEKASRFRPYLALCMIVAWRVMYVMMLGRECPDLPCDVAFDDEEWRAVYAVVKNETPPKEPPSLGEMVVMVAMLGGYMNRKGDGEPGPKAMWVGMQRMTDLALAWRAFARHGPIELAKKIT